MKQLYLKFDAWFSARETREQWILAIIMLLMVGWFTWVLIVDPAQLKYGLGVEEHRQVEAHRVVLAEQVATLEEQVAVDPNVALRERLDTLVGERDKLGALLDEKAEFMHPQQLLAWLEALLDSGSGLTLEAFTTAPPEPFLKGEEKISDVRILQYPVTVQLAGNFFAIHNYLEELAALPLSFYWQGFDYQVEKHPKAVITLNLFTLSYSVGADEI